MPLEWTFFSIVLTQAEEATSLILVIWSPVEKEPVLASILLRSTFTFP